MLKWKWRILEKENLKWKEVLYARYENIQLIVQNSIDSNNNISKSTWWKDLINLENRYFGEDFLSRCIFSVGNSASILFWNAAWIKDKNLKSLFPNLYALSNSKGCGVAEAGNRNRNSLSWGEFGIPISQDPAVNIDKVNLRIVLLEVIWQSEEQDSVIWTNNYMEGYSANSGQS